MAMEIAFRTGIVILLVLLVFLVGGVFLQIFLSRIFISLSTVLSLKFVSISWYDCTFR